ncbi:MAG TPA: Imm6 family immunity protein [Bacillota bacterium]|nr:Imm6 family immunity protein [Bacillota bacterium]HOL10789.1 Imm6 family immunity protein [Bacillota bacterium]HPO98245.1 Imm6 family immunity protein [Bacillota bacterium]
MIKLDGICENGKVALALILAEITLNNIEHHDLDYEFCRESIDICWKWLEEDVDKEAICILIANDGNCLADITVKTADDKLGNMYGTIMASVSYLAWQAYNKEKDYHYPQYLEMVNDEYLIDLIKDLIEIDKLITEENLSYILNYFKDNYPENNKYCKISKTEMIDQVVSKIIDPS